MTESHFHLREGFTYRREGGEVIVGHREHTLRIPITEWASAVAFTAKAEKPGTYQEVLELLNRD